MSWLRSFLNEDSCDLFAAGSLPCTFLLACSWSRPYIVCCWARSSCSFPRAHHCCRVCSSSLWLVILLLIFGFSTCCAWHTTRPGLLVPINVLLVKLICWLLTSKVSVTSHRSRRSSPDTAHVVRCCFKGIRGTVNWPASFTSSHSQIDSQRSDRASRATS